MRFNSKQSIVVCENSKTKTASLFAVIVIIAASTAGLWWAGSSGAENDSEISDEDLQAAIQDEFAKLSAEYDSEMMAEYGITYSEYNAVMDYLSDKAIYITVENGDIVAYFVESIDKGKTMTESELRGDQLRIYIDTVSMAGLTSAGITGFTAALGALIGSVYFPGIGTLSGTAVGIIVGLIGGSMLSAFYQFVVEQESLDNGIWLDITVRGHFTVLGHTVYYNLPPYMWSIAGYGKQ